MIPDFRPTRPEWGSAKHSCPCADPLAGLGLPECQTGSGALPTRVPGTGEF